MNKDRVVIEVNGMRYIMEHAVPPLCSACIANGLCNKDNVINLMCIGGYTCTSACKIDPEPKMYFAWNREEARMLVGKEIEHSVEYNGAEWKRGKLLEIVDSIGCYSFSVDGILRPIIREIPTIEMTMAQFREKYGVPDNVVIVEGE